jgi:hypothetical protein
MTEFNQVLDGGVAERVFFIVSIIFMLLYACGILLMWRTETGPRRTALHRRTTMLHRRTTIMALFLAVAISAVAGGLGLIKPSSGGAVNGPVSTSIIDLQSAVDMKALPLQKMHDATFVFDNE